MLRLASVDAVPVRLADAVPPGVPATRSCACTVPLALASGANVTVTVHLPLPASCAAPHVSLVSWN